MLYTRFDFNIKPDFNAERFASKEIEQLNSMIDDEVANFEKHFDTNLFFRATRPYKKMLREIAFSAKGRVNHNSKIQFLNNFEEICDMVFEAISSIYAAYEEADNE